MVRRLVLSLTLFLCACGGNISANNTASTDVVEPSASNTADTNMADFNYATADMNAFANGDSNYAIADTNAYANGDGNYAPADANYANGGNHAADDGPSANVSNDVAEPANTSGSAQASDPRITQLCGSEELADTACRSLGNQFRNLEAGVGALNAPAEMAVDGTYTVALAIGRDEDVDVVTATAEGEAGPAATSNVGEVQLARRMRVTLSGSAFRIAAESEAERELGLSRQATWRWQVTPTAEGRQSLVATVEPIAVLADGRRIELGPARRRLDVRVSVTAEQRMGRWERFLKSTTGVLVALAALIAAAGLIVWRVRSFGKKPD